MAEGDVFVGNLPHDASENDIKAHFSTVGQVHSIKLVTDRKGRSRCFGFISIENPEEVVEALNEKEFQERKLRVSRAIPQNDFRPRSRGGFHRRGR